MAALLPVETERLTLRQLVPEDLDALHAYHRLEEVARYQFWSERSREELKARLAEWIEMDGSEGANGKLCLACVRESDGQLIGDLFLGVSDREARQGEIGYSFNPAFHRQGFGSEAVSRLLTLGFDVQGLHRIIGRCDARNTASWKLLEKLGMRREAHFREHAIFKGEWDEEFYYAILEDEWRARQKAHA